MPVVLERSDILSVLASSRQNFKETIVAHYHLTYGDFDLLPVYSVSRLYEAYEAWKKDLERVSRMELRGHELDHFKQSGHLCYWLRRKSPIIEVNRDPAKSGAPISALANALLLQYANEFTAFDAGFRISRFFECKRDDVYVMVKMLGRIPQRPTQISDLTLSLDFYQTICQFLKEKNVSPHALFLIYKSLFAPFSRK